MTPDSIQSVAIVGGGSAGWMAAAALATQVPGVAITLVESDAIGTVGVGEATIPPIKLFNQMLGIPEADFVARTQGSFKLGIQFVGWGAPSSRYFHPFGTYGADFDAVPLHHWWLRERARGDQTPLDDLSMAWAMAKRARFAPPSGDRRLIQSTFDYAYHFDAGLYARLLRSLAEQRGVVRQEGRIAGVERHPETGAVTAVAMEDGQRIAADFWIDCSGFAGLLISGALGTPYIDWSHWLPCDRALAVPCEAAWAERSGAGKRGAGDFTPYTRSTARAAGWQWRIPLQHRIGNGYVYASSRISDDEAAATLLANLDGPALADPRPLRFTTGRRAQAWAGNVVAIGLAAGFMEPLESTSLHLVQSSLMRLLSLWPSRAMEAHVRDEFNRATAVEWERIRDFLILHYHLNSRDEPLWRDCAAMAVPESLQWKLQHFRSHARLVSDGPELFLNPSWLAVHIGQGNIPAGWDPLVEARGAVEAARHLAGLRRVMGEAAAEMPVHGDFIARHCAAPPLAA
jgi:tryptophan halogenase